MTHFIFGLITAILLKYNNGLMPVGNYQPHSCIMEVLRDIGYKQCTKECLRRAQWCRLFSYNRQQLTCYLVNSTSCICPYVGSTRSAISDITQFQRLVGGCSSMICEENEVCVELSNSSICMTIDTPIDCKSLYDQGNRRDGVYVIYPFLPDKKRVPIICDMIRGGASVVSRRMDGSVDFNAIWDNYKHGFGYLDGEFWIGNEVIHHLSQLAGTKMHIRLTNYDGVTKYADYATFLVANETNKYRLTASGYSGTAGNALTCSNSQFSTVDQDNDSSPKSCAKEKKGAWWYAHCCFGHLTSYCGQGVESVNCNRWYTFNGNYGYQYTEMMFYRHA